MYPKIHLIQVEEHSRYCTSNSANPRACNSTSRAHNFKIGQVSQSCANIHVSFTNAIRTLQTHYQLVTFEHLSQGAGISGTFRRARVNFTRNAFENGAVRSALGSPILATGKQQHQTAKVPLSTARLSFTVSLTITNLRPATFGN